MSNINRISQSQIIRDVAQVSGHSIKDCTEIINALMPIIETELVQNGYNTRVYFKGYGYFSLKKTAARNNALIRAKGIKIRKTNKNHYKMVWKTSFQRKKKLFENYGDKDL